MILQSITKAIAKSGKSRYQISKETGIDQTVLFRIVNGGGCSIETVDRLCKCLGLELRPRRTKRKATQWRR
jgi:DNA-binding phage protein